MEGQKEGSVSGLTIGFFLPFWDHPITFLHERHCCTHPHFCSDNGPLSQWCVMQSINSFTFPQRKSTSLHTAVRHLTGYGKDVGSLATISTTTSATYTSCSPRRLPRPPPPLPLATSAWLHTDSLGISHRLINHYLTKFGHTDLFEQIVHNW